MLAASVKHKIGIQKTKYSYPTCRSMLVSLCPFSRYRKAGILEGAAHLKERNIYMCFDSFPIFFPIDC